MPFMPSIWNGVSTRALSLFNSSPPSSSSESSVTQPLARPIFLPTGSLMRNTGQPVSTMKLNGPLPLILTRTSVCCVSVKRNGTSRGLASNLIVSFLGSSVFFSPAETSAGVMRKTESTNQRGIMLDLQRRSIGLAALYLNSVDKGIRWSRFSSHATEPRQIETTESAESTERGQELV